MTQPAHTYPEHVKAVLVLGVPLIASNVGGFVIHMTDTIMLGWYDVTSLAAASLTGTLFFLTYIVGAGFGFAVTPLVAAAAETGDETEGRRVTRMAAWLSVIYGLALTPPFFFTEDILLAMGQDPVVAAEGHRYLTIVVLGLVPMLLANVLKSFLAGLELTGFIFWTTVITAVLNAAVNYVLIFGHFGAPELGIRGAAIASVLLQVVTLVLLLLYALRKLPQFQLLRRIWVPDGQIMARVFRLGLPIGLTSLAEGGMFTAATIMVGWLGAIPLAAHGVALQLASLTFVVHVGFSQAATVRAGRALGRQDETALRRGGIVAFALSGAFVVVAVAAFLLVPEPLVGVFIGPNEPERDAVIVAGVSLLIVAALFHAVDAFQVMALGLLRGVQDTRVPMYWAVVSYWCVGLPASYIMGFPVGWGAEGVWLGLCVGLTLAAITLCWRFWGRSVHITETPAQSARRA